MQTQNSNDDDDNKDKTASRDVHGVEENGLMINEETKKEKRFVSAESFRRSQKTSDNAAEIGSVFTERVLET